MEMKKIISIVCIGCSSIWMTPIISSCNKSTSETVHVDKNIWKNAWKAFSDYEKRNFKMSATGTWKLYWNDKEIINVDAIDIEYAAQKSESYFWDKEVGGKEYVWYSTLNHDYLWECRNPTSATPTYEVSIVGGRTLADESIIASIITVIARWNNLFVYDQTSKTTTWTLFSGDMLNLNWIIHFSDNNLIDKMDLDANLKINDFPDVGNIKIDFDLEFNIDYSAQEWKTPASNPDSLVKKLEVSGDEIKWSTDAAFVDHVWVLSLEDVPAANKDGKKTITITGKDMILEDYQFNFSIYKNGKALSLIANDYKVENNVITLTEPLVGTDKVNFSLCLLPPLYQEEHSPVAVTLS